MAKTRKNAIARAQEGRSLNHRENAARGKRDVASPQKYEINMATDVVDQK